MATTGELRAIIQELQLVEIGDAASYLGEEGAVEEEYHASLEPVNDAATLCSCDSLAGCCAPLV